MHITQAAAGLDGLGAEDTVEGAGVWVKVVVLGGSNRPGVMTVAHKPAWPGSKPKKFLRNVKLLKQPIKWRGYTQAWVGKQTYDRLFGAAPSGTPSLTMSSIVNPTIPTSAGPQPVTPASALVTPAVPVAHGPAAAERESEAVTKQYRGGVFHDTIFSQRLFD